MRKLAFCLCENKDADQLRGNREADQRLCFRYTDSTIPTTNIRNFKPLAIFCGCTACFVSALVGKPKDRFSHNEVNMCQGTQTLNILWVMNQFFTFPKPMTVSWIQGKTFAIYGESSTVFKTSFDTESNRRYWIVLFRKKHV